MCTKGRISSRVRQIDARRLLAQLTTDQFRRLPKRWATFGNLSSNKGLPQAFSACRPLGYEGKLDAQSNQRKTIRANNGAGFSVWLLAGLRSFGLEF